MIFAAGFGTRMRPLTDKTPKPLIQVAGKALIDHALEQGQRGGIRKIIVNTHYFPEQITEHLKNQNVIFSHEVDTVLDTGGGLKKAIPLADTTEVFTMNSDAVWTGENPFDQLAYAWNPETMDALLLLSKPENTTGHKGKGSFDKNDSDQLTRGNDLVFLGAQIIKTELVDNVDQHVFSLNLVWDQIISRGRLFGVTHNGGWCDVGYPQAIPIAEELLESDA